jgi:hypothetical protein
VPTLRLVVDLLVEEVLMMEKVEHLANERERLNKKFKGFRVLGFQRIRVSGM